MGSILSRFRHLLTLKRLAILEACLIGLVAGLAAVLLQQGVGWLGGWRIYLSHRLPIWLALPGMGFGGGWIAGWLVERFAPETSGSGIPQVKAALAGEPMPMDLRVAVIKLAGGILALGSGLPLGREGPTVQAGAALAAQFSRWLPTSPDHRRQLMAAGAGAGLAAAFNAPIAGVLFVVEELLQDVSSLTLGTAILASFIGSVISRVWGGQSLDIDLNVVVPPTNFTVEEIPFYLILGILAGGVGAIFNQGILTSLTLNFRVFRLGLPWQVGLAGLLTGLLTAFLPISFHDNAGLRELLISGEAGWQFAVVAFITQFFIILLAYGSGAPGGLFAPTLILGAALGYLVGSVEYHFFGISSPVTYALAGMGALFSAVVRVPVTAIVIIFEMTTDFNLVLPLMIGCVVAYLVGEKVASGSLYDRLLHWSGIDLEKETAPSEGLAGLTAASVMQRRVETLSSQMSLKEVTQAFARSPHRGFPVVAQGKLVGIITQTDLTNTSHRELTAEMPLREIMTPQPITISPQASLAEVLYLLNRYKLSRLPVSEGRKLVGIITRSDIIQAESEKLGGEICHPRSEPSYVVSQNRAPATGRGRLLVPIANPETAEALLQIAAAIAQDRHFELECLQVILVARTQVPAETPVRTTASRRLLRRAEQVGREWQIPVHTQIRAAQDLAQAILETVEQSYIDLIVMGWKGGTATPGRVFGGAVDTLIRQAACEVVLVKLPTPAASAKGLPTFDHWLIPVAGGPNAQTAIKLLPGLVKLAQMPNVKLCQVLPSWESNTKPSILEVNAAFVRDLLNCPVETAALVSAAVPEAILDLAQTDHRDVILIGASRESLLQRVIKGNIPKAIAHHSHCTVILVRGALS